MAPESFTDIVKKEYDSYAEHGIMFTSNPSDDVAMATERAKTHAALSSFSREEIERFKNIESTGEGFRRDAHKETYRGKVYLVDYLETLTELQKAQLITYFILRPITFHKDPRRFVMMYDEDVAGFRIELMPGEELVTEN